MNINQFEWESREFVERAKKWEVQEISIKS